MKSKESVRAENSLREFMLEEFARDSRVVDRMNNYKYKGLSLEVKREHGVQPRFTVELGAFEATFSIATGKKLEGGLQEYDVILVQKWASKSANRSLLQLIWETYNKEKKDVKLQPFDLED